MPKTRLRLHRRRGGSKESDSNIKKKGVCDTFFCKLLYICIQLFNDLHIYFV